jgi:hypothetical protein
MMCASYLIFLEKQIFVQFHMHICVIMSVLKVKKDIIISIAVSPITFFETFKTEPVATQENMRIVFISKKMAVIYICLLKLVFLFIIYNVNLHGNPVFSLVYTKVTFLSVTLCSMWQVVFLSLKLIFSQ